MMYTYTGKYAYICIYIYNMIAASGNRYLHEPKSYVPSADPNEINEVNVHLKTPSIDSFEHIILEKNL